MTDSPLPAEPRTHPDPAFHHPYCQFRREGDDCTCVEGREAAPEPRPDLREALDVERLARAVMNTDRVPMLSGWPGYLDWAQRIADEYNRAAPAAEGTKA